MNSAAGSFGLSFGLAVAGGIMLAALSLSFTDMTEASTRDPRRPAGADRPDARGRRPGDEQHPARRAARRRTRRRSEQRSSASTPTPGTVSLQVALLVPVLASLIGLLNSFRMMRLPDITPSASLEGTTLG